MLILADLIATRQMYLMQSSMSSDLLRLAIVAEVFALIAIAVLGIAVFRKGYRRQKKPVSRLRFAFVRPIRRAVAVVWT